MPEQNLKITINVDDKGASSKIGKVTGALNALNERVGTLNGSGLPALSKNLREFCGALKDLSSINGTNIASLGKNVNHMLVTLGRLDISRYQGNIDKTTAQLAKMIDTFSSFSTNTGDMDNSAKALENLPKAFEALEKIPNDKMADVTQTLNGLAKATAAASKNGNGIQSLATGIKRLPGALDNFGKAEYYKDSIEEVKKTIEELGNVKVAGGSSFEAAVSGVSKLPEAFEKFGDASQYSTAIQSISTTLEGLGTAVQHVSGQGANLRNLAEGLERLPGALSGFSSEKSYEDNIRALGVTLEKLGETVQTVDKDATKGFRGLVSSISALSRVGKDEGLDEKLAALAESVKKFVASLETITDEQAQKVYNLGVGMKGMVDAAGRLDSAMQKLNKSGNINWATVLKDALKKLGSELKKLPKRVFAATKAILKFVSLPLRPIANGFERLTQGISRFFHSVGRIALYRLIRSGIKMVTEGVKEGIDNLYQWALVVGNDFAPTMDTLASEFLYLKNSLGAALSPIIQALEPIIIDLINRFVELLNVFNQFVSMLTGRDTWRKALYYPTQYAEGAEDALAGAGKEAKELENILMDFDQLNLITTPKDRNRTGGAGDDDALDYALMFEEVPLNEHLFDWLKEADWSKFGREFADKIADALEKINWNRFRNVGKDLAKKLSSFLNGAFDNERLFSDVGETIAEAFNTATSTINEFVYNTNWTKLGSDLALSLKKLLAKLDPVELGKSLAAGGFSLASIIHGFAENMGGRDWSRLAETIYTTVSVAMNSIPWETLIPDLVEIGTGLIQAITAAIKGVATAKDRIWQGVQNADWESFKQALADMFTALCEDIPVIPIVLTFSLVNVAFDVASKAIAGRMFAGAVAKALGGTVAGGTGASGAGGAMSAIGAGLSSVGPLPAIAVALAAIVTVWVTWNYAEEKAKNAKEKEKFDDGAKKVVEDNLKTGTYTDPLDTSNSKHFYQGVLDPAVQDAINNVNDFQSKLETLREVLRPQHLGLPATQQGFADLTLKLDDLSAGLQSNDPYTVARTAEEIGRLWKIVDSANGAMNYGSTVSDSLGRAFTNLASQGSVAAFTLNGNVEEAKKTLDELYKSGKVSLLEYNRISLDLSSKSETAVKNACAEIEKIVNKTRASVTSAFTGVTSGAYRWGTDIAKNLASGLDNNIKLVSQASIRVAKGIQQNLAFSEPEEGPLSNFHTYMPDMIDLMVQGIKENQYKVENQVASLAGTVAGIRNVAVDTATLGGSDSAGSVADDLYNANAEERQLLRELISAVRQQKLTISPSATLGKVVNQSSRLYAGVTG